MNKLPLVPRLFRPKDLVAPTVIFATNHLLIVNKSPGWLTVPTDKGWDQKSLIHRLQNLELGGGSKKDWLTPLHRIDQPCSGLVVLGKTTKACQRIQPLWRDGKVKKTYLVVLSQPHAQSHGWSNLEGHMIITSKKSLGSHKQAVQFTNEPYPNTKYCQMRYRSLSPTLLQVSTNQGARHMVRALLHFHGYRLAGDLRYGANRALEDHSVALHAFSIVFPNELSLGDLEQKYFEAPIPATWEQYFGITQDHVNGWRKEKP